MKFKNLIFVFLITVFIFFLITMPQLCKSGAIEGILLCGRVIIPSLFPFTMCVLFILNSGVLDSLEKISPITKKFLGLSAKEFSVFLLSSIGGYPIGAKLLEEAEDISGDRASFMLNYCVNAGPAFIIAAVGNGILGSKVLGFVLYGSYILSSFFLCFISRFFMPKENGRALKKRRALNPADNFVISASKAAATVFSICAFVILFSSINAYIEHFKILKPLSFILEVTNAVTFTNNIYLISFLLGLGGISIWCQVMAEMNRIKINFPLFLIFRCLHGTLSVAFTALFVKLFGIALPTLQNGNSFAKAILYSTPQLAVSMLIMAIIFIISLQTKKYAGKIIEDMV